MQVERNNFDALAVNSLPDGSRVIFDHANEMVVALNATAGAAWDACSEPTTLSSVTEKMRNSLDPAITEEIAQDAILQLQEKNLVRTSGQQASRRKFIASLGAIAVPLVVSLPIAEQKAYAQRARSMPTSNPRPVPTSPRPPKDHHDNPIEWLLGLLG